MPSTASDTVQAFDIASVARQYSVSKRTVQRWITRGLPFRQERPGCKVLIEPAAIEAFLHRRACRGQKLQAMVNETMEDLMCKMGKR